ncbi:hypothetical protein M9Y10_013178 [Tritrichomonas musculus]|uniref:Uncharacterized protein n=1 Tax=Tritrichomonas musculus TaxID=1915356 RepID=A0ABR2I7N3_9EUKA
MKIQSQSRSPHIPSRGSRSPSPSYRLSHHSPSNNRYYSVPVHLSTFLTIFVLLNVILFIYSLKMPILVIPLIVSLACTYVAYKKIDGAALVQVNDMKSSLSSEQISSIIVDTNSPFVDNHVRAKLIETTRRHK